MQADNNSQMADNLQETHATDNFIDEARTEIINLKQPSWMTIVLLRSSFGKSPLMLPRIRRIKVKSYLYRRSSVVHLQLYAYLLGSTGKTNITWLGALSHIPC